MVSSPFFGAETRLAHKQAVSKIRENATFCQKQQKLAYNKKEEENFVFSPKCATFAAA